MSLDHRSIPSHAGDFSFPASTLQILADLPGSIFFFFDHLFVVSHGTNAQRTHYLVEGVPEIRLACLYCLPF